MAKYKRAANGTGTVRKLSGNRRRAWQALLPAYENEDGNLIRETLGFYETRQEAVDALALHRLCPEPTDTTLTFRELHAQWEESFVAKLGAQSQRSYKSAWDKFKPIYDYKVTDVKTPQLQFCFDRIAETGASISTLNNMRVVAYKLEKFAMQQDIINKNYAQFVVLPKAESNEKAIFDDFQLRKIEQGAKDKIGVSWHILVMCYTGWRIQEYCNLTVFDYDKENHTLQGGVKTEAGKKRIVPVPDKVLPYVEAQFANCEKLCVMSSRALRAHFYTTLAALGIQGEEERIYTPHTTRHTYNSMLLKKGVPVELRLKLMGQKDEKTNINIYSHAELETLQKAVGKL